MSVLGAALGAGASALGSLFGFGSQKSSNKANQKLAAQQNEYNQQLAAQQNDYNLAYQQNEFAQNSKQSELEYQRNLEMWNLQNEYNSPEAQIGRFQAAGLNPNLIYGNGSAAAGNASSAPEFTAAKYSAPQAQRANAERAQVQPNFRNNLDPYQAISLSENLAIQRAQRDQISAQADYTRQQTVNSALDSLSKDFDVKFKRDTRELAMEQLYETLQKTRASSTLDWRKADHELEKANLTRHQQDIVRQELKNLAQTNDIRAFELKLAKLGVTNRDGFITRLLSRVFINSLTSKGQSLFNF